MKKYLFASLFFSLVPGIVNAKTIVCSSPDSAVQVRIAYGPHGEPPPGIEIQRSGYFEEFLIIRPPNIQTGALQNKGSISGWTYKGRFERDGKDYLFVMTVPTKAMDGSADSASWYFNAGQFDEFTVLDCK